jgi:hypothetical protein
MAQQTANTLRFVAMVNAGCALKWTLADRAPVALLFSHALYLNFSDTVKLGASAHAYHNRTTPA